VRVERDGAQPAITLCDFEPWEGGDQAKTLARLAATHDLGRARCTTILDASEYTLLLTEAPDVPPDELRQALRWRIKDLIDFHINDATLDVFDVPGDKSPGRARPMYAVAARSSAIQARADLLTQAGVHLDVIDIVELAQRNIAALLPEDARGVALLAFGRERGLITVTRQADLYLSRNLEIGSDSLAPDRDLAQYFDRIVLEVQRSLDYYDSHFRQAPVTTLALAPLPAPVPGLVEHLRANLGLAVQEIDLRALLACPGDLPLELQARCLPTLGAALRHEEAAL
jgi:MSHA biogenesis protein MshI